MRRAARVWLTVAVLYTQTVALTLFAVRAHRVASSERADSLRRLHRRVPSLQMGHRCGGARSTSLIVPVGGLVVRLVGIACMIAARANPSSVRRRRAARLTRQIAGLVLTQLVQGVGGGIASVGGTVAAQAAVPHADVAIAVRSRFRRSD